jgi:hypothetical protein
MHIILAASETSLQPQSMAHIANYVIKRKPSRHPTSFISDVTSSTLPPSTFVAPAPPSVAILPCTKHRCFCIAQSTTPSRDHTHCKPRPSACGRCITSGRRSSGPHSAVSGFAKRSISADGTSGMCGSVGGVPWHTLRTCRSAGTATPWCSCGW